MNLNKRSPLFAYEVPFYSVEESMMSVGDGRQSVYFEILVRSNLTDALNGSPIGEWRLSIIEPLIAQILQVIVVKVSHSLGYFTSRNSSSHIHDLFGNCAHDWFRSLLIEESIIKVVSASIYFHIIQEVTVNSRETHSAIVHLSGEYFISEEVVAPYSTVRVCIVQTVSLSYINQITNQRMHWIILLMDIIEMFSMLVNSIVPKHMFQELKGIVVWVFDRGSIIEHTHIGVVHLIISNVEKSWSENGFFSVLLLFTGCLLHNLEVVIYLGNKLFMVDIAHSDNYQVFSIIISFVEFSDHILINRVDVVSISLHWLPHHMFSEDIEMHILNGGLHVSFVIILVFLANLLLNQL
jgi:hypothetical protein